MPSPFHPPGRPGEFPERDLPAARACLTAFLAGDPAGAGPILASLEALRRDDPGFLAGIRRFLVADFADSFRPLASECVDVTESVLALLGEGPDSADHPDGVLAHLAVCPGCRAVLDVTQQWAATMPEWRTLATMARGREDWPFLAWIGRRWHRWQVGVPSRPVGSQELAAGIRVAGLAVGLWRPQGMHLSSAGPGLRLSITPPSADFEIPLVLGPSPGAGGSGAEWRLEVGFPTAGSPAVLFVGLGDARRSRSGMRRLVPGTAVEFPVSLPGSSAPLFLHFEWSLANGSMASASVLLPLVEPTQD